MKKINQLVIIIFGLFTTPFLFSSNSIKISFKNGEKGEFEKEKIELLSAQTDAISSQWHKKSPLNLENYKPETENLLETEIVVSKEGFTNFLEKIFLRNLEESNTNYWLKKELNSLTFSQIVDILQTISMLGLNTKSYFNKIQNYILEKSLSDEHIKNLKNNIKISLPISDIFKPDITKKFLEKFFSDPTWTEWFWISPKFVDHERTFNKTALEKTKNINSNMLETLSKAYFSSQSGDPSSLILANPMYFQGKSSPYIIASYPDDEASNGKLVISNQEQTQAQTIINFKVLYMEVNHETQELAYVTQNHAIGTLNLNKLAEGAYQNYLKNKVHTTIQFDQLPANVRVQHSPISSITFHDVKSQKFIPYDPIPIDAIKWVDNTKLFIAMRNTFLGLYDISQGKFVGDLISIPSKVNESVKTMLTELSKGKNKKIKQTVWYRKFVFSNRFIPRVVPEKKVQLQKISLDFRKIKNNGYLAFAINNPQYARVIKLNKLDEHWTVNIRGRKDDQYNIKGATVYTLKQDNLSHIQKLDFYQGAKGYLESSYRGKIGNIKLNPNGKELVIAWENGTIKFIPLKDNNGTEKTYRSHTQKTKIALGFKKFTSAQLAFSPSGSFLLATRPSGKAKIFDSLFREKDFVMWILPFVANGMVTHIAWSADGTLIGLASNKGVAILPIQPRMHDDFIDTIKKEMTIDGARALKYMYTYNIKRRGQLPDHMLPLFDTLPAWIKNKYVLGNKRSKGSDYRGLKNVDKKK